MRWIDVSGLDPGDEWRAESERRTAKLRDMTDSERRVYLGGAAAAQHWGVLRELLGLLGHDKCWYTEAATGAGDAQIEHFRPKRGNAPGSAESHAGYWWLAFDCRNYRLIASIPNRTKSNEFPISGCRAAEETDNLDDELPVLLDPTKANDVALLTFGDGGVPMPTPGLDDVERSRVEYTISRCGLRHPQITRQREAIWNECGNALKEWMMVRKQAPNSPSGRALADATAARLRRMGRPNAPYSQAAVACLRQKREANMLASS